MKVVLIDDLGQSADVDGGRAYTLLYRHTTHAMKLARGSHKGADSFYQSISGTTSVLRENRGWQKLFLWAHVRLLCLLGVSSPPLAVPLFKIQVHSGKLRAQVFWSHLAKHTQLRAGGLWFFSPNQTVITLRG